MVDGVLKSKNEEMNSAYIIKFYIYIYIMVPVNVRVAID